MTSQLVTRIFEEVETLLHRAPEEYDCLLCGKRPPLGFELVTMGPPGAESACKMGRVCDTHELWELTNVGGLHVFITL